MENKGLTPIQKKLLNATQELRCNYQTLLEAFEYVQNNVRKFSDENSIREYVASFIKNIDEADEIIKGNRKRTSLFISQSSDEKMKTFVEKAREKYPILKDGVELPLLELPYMIVELMTDMETIQNGLRNQIDQFIKNNTMIRNIIIEGMRSHPKMGSQDRKSVV